MSSSSDDVAHKSSSTLLLPQPSHNTKQYSYVLYNEIESTFFHNPLKEGSLCWVLKSKAKSSRAELFLRARVVRDEQPNDNNGHRVLVRYPKGSTYHVRRANLIPVLENHHNIVIVVPETPLYRRACVVHTCVDDSFLEIGCDFGPTVDRVQTALTRVGAVPRIVGEPVDSIDVPPGRVVCLGVDKSQDSIDIAVERFPDCTFSVQDGLTPTGTVKLRALCKKKLLHKYPSVVAVDINGNRELPAVLTCVNNVMNPGDNVIVGKDWELPRLIIVKSRLLYAEMKQQQEDVDKNENACGV